MRFTPLLVAVTISQISSITTTVGSAKPSQSRMNEMCFDAGRDAVLVLEPRRERQAAEDQRDHGLADHLGLAAQAEAALPDDLDVVVEEADRAHARRRGTAAAAPSRSARSS